MNHFFDIIVPIYKVESFLSQCITSVIQQSFQDFRLILVNDGSPDNCLQICKSFSKSDTRIIIVDKLNGGLSDARNAGLKKCTGKYVLFLDGDDFLTSNCLKMIHHHIQINPTSELVLGGYNIILNEILFKNTKINFSSPYTINNNIEFLERIIIENGDIPWAAWQHIYSTKIIEEHKICFKQGLVGAEDCDFFINYLNYVNNVSLLQFPVINYRISRKDSITNNIKFAAIDGQLNVFKKFYYQFFDSILIKELFAQKYANAASTIIHLTDKVEIKNIENNIDKKILAFKNFRQSKYLVANFLWNLLGIYNGSLVIDKFRNIKKNGNKTINI